MISVQGYFIELAKSEFDYLTNLETDHEKYDALNIMLRDRFTMGREYGKTAMRDKLLESICNAIIDL